MTLNPTEVQKTIYKYTVPVDTVLHLPQDAEILTVQVQHNVPQLWALVDPAAPTTPRHIRTYGTGHSIDDNVEYIDSFQLHNGDLVFHVFEVVPEPGEQNEQAADDT